ncbi:MAG: 1-deoxy-D-xylulose-5-phosphate reductoisomerase [Eubacteriales bacterium]|nr:1-deoxy-D-xylulose-5-phosphate reductoisomerase [Eubacteriales bacterium]
MKKLLLLGSSGSIGTQTLDVVRAMPGEFQIMGLSVNRNVELLAKQAAEFSPRYAAVADESAAEAARRLLPPGVTLFAGAQGLLEMCRACYGEADMAVHAIVGIAGLPAVVACIQGGMDIALANKETLVAGGALVERLKAQHGVALYPVDSEHSAIFQCMQGLPDRAAVKRILLTASGGPFFGYSREQLEGVTVEQALKHPNWSMGSKITIDSATMMNKGLEVIEAKWLFSAQPEDIRVLVHRQSIVHSLIELQDHSVLAQLGCPDMRIPIQYALVYPRRVPGPAPELDLCAAGALTFAQPDWENFPCLGLAYAALAKGNRACVAINAANEAAVARFLRREIKFMDIPRIIERALGNAPQGDCQTLEEILEMDAAVRGAVLGR